MEVHRINNINFTGIQISKIKINGLKSDYRLYEVSQKDTGFLNKMYNSVDLKKLYDGLKADDYEIWDGLLKQAINGGTRLSGQKVLIETCDNIPCGVLKYTPAPKHYYLNYIVTFPNKPGQRVPFAGQILFNELFRRFIPHNACDIQLDALRNSPFSPISKYLKLGFKMRGGDSITEEMCMNKQGAADIFTKQNEFIKSEPVKSKRDINLNNVIQLLKGFAKDN